MVKFCLTLLLMLGLFGGNGVGQEKVGKGFVNGDVWLDTKGNPINAHGGGILFHKGKYYWYGEIKSGKTTLVPGQKWQCYRTDAGGVSCYSSRNLVDWKYEGVALPPVFDDVLSDLHVSRVLERPKVVYNVQTKKFVMWLHIDNEDYSYARAGVAVSDSPAGPFRYLGSVRPNGQMSRDITLFKDLDGRAYIVYSSENNATMHVCLLSDDYLQPTTEYIRIFIGKKREAPAVFHHDGKYYMVTSGLTGWAPNKAMLAVADSMMGQWKLLYNPCRGPKEELTFGAQSNFVLPLAGKENEFIFMGDRWNMTNLADSRYVWLPFAVAPDSVQIHWQDRFVLKRK